jgi:hypothetical protein
MDLELFRDLAVVLAANEQVNRLLLNDCEF